MDKIKILETIKALKENSAKRNFNQSFDMIVNFKDLDLKKTSLDVFLTVPHSRGKSVKICGIVGEELEKQAKECCDEVILDRDLKKYSDKKLGKKISKNYDFFVAQSNLMGQIATVFGRTLGPLGKMPNPKLGGVLLPNSDIKPVVEKFKKSVRLMTKKNESIIKCAIGKENMKDEEIAENCLAIYENIVHNLPKGEQNIKSVLIKLTMSKPVKIGEKIKVVKEDIEEKVENIVRLKQKNNVVHLKTKPNKVILKKPKNNVVRLKQKEGIKVEDKK